MLRALDRPRILPILVMLLAPAAVSAQMRGQWHVTAGDAAHDRWQKVESKISIASFPNSFQLLWKLQLGNSVAQAEAFNEALTTPNVITARGFKDMVFWGNGDTLYAADYALGTLLWKKSFPAGTHGSHKGCGAPLPIVLEPPLVIHFGMHRAGAPHAAPPPPAAPSARRLGASAGGGGFGLKGMYVLTGDGYLHEQILTTGLDFAPPVKFLPEPAQGLSALNIGNKVIYADSGGCSNAPNTVWSIDLDSAQYPVASYPTEKVRLLGRAGPAIGSDGTVYLSTGPGAANPSTGAQDQVHAGSVVALTERDLKVKDWYTPQRTRGDSMLPAGPIVVSYQGKDLVVGPGKDGNIALLDSQSLGGTDHATPLAETARIAKPGKKSAWTGLASWEDRSGTLWILASIPEAVLQGRSFANTYGPAAHGGIVAFKVEQKDGRTALTPAWISRDMRNPAPPVVVNGVVFALAQGDAAHHAVLYALDAATGKELYSSGDAIESYAHLSGVSTADSQVFFATHDNTLYSFGVPMEH